MTDRIISLLPRHCITLFLTLAAFLAAVGASAGAQERVPDGKAGTDVLWAQGVDGIIHGKFSEARASLALILESQPGEESYHEVASWLDRRSSDNATRTELQAKQRAQHLRLAKKHLAKNEWETAFDYVRYARICSLAEASFMSEPWVQKLHDEIVSLARKHEEAGEWRDAAGLYFQLTQVYEGNAEYERKLDECGSHSRLEFLYGEDSEWKVRLRGVTPSIVEDALWEIHRRYVVEPDLRAGAKNGLRQLRLLAESEVLLEMYPGLKDEDDRRMYVRRLDRQIKKVDRLEDYSYKDLNKAFELVLDINDQTVKLDRELIIYEFFEKVLGSEGSLDKFTSMIWPVDYPEFQKHTQGRFYGVGIQISLPLNKKLTVVTPLEGTPAYRAGIQADDVITHVNGEPTEGLTLTGAVRTIMGPVGTEVVLTIYRPRTKKSFDVSLMREQIEIQSVKGYRRSAESQEWDFMLDSDFKIGYIRLTSFQDTSVGELKETLQRLQEQGMRGLILDLRFNPGGLLQSAIEIAEMFLPDGDDIVSTAGRRLATDTKSSRSKDRHCKLPLVVLVNGSSASASEIVAGALKDHDRALVVGERSFGKGSVQNLIRVGHTNAYLKLTTAQYYLPSGRSIHRLPESETWGVEPDIEVALVRRETDKIRRMNREADIIHLEDLDAASEAEAPEPSDDSASTEHGEKPAKPADDTERGEEPATPVGDAQPVEGQPGTESKTEEEAEEAEEVEELIEYPAVDYQLETAALVLRVQLLQKLGFGILPKVKLGDGRLPSRKPTVVTN